MIKPDIEPKNKEILRPGCEFCDAEEIENQSVFFKIHDLPQVLWKNLHTKVVMDTYPLTEGHLMLITNEHYVSSARVMNERVINDDLSGVLNFMAHIYEGYPLVIFEHGSGSQGQERVGGCGKICGPSNDHAHIHIVPALNPTTKAVVKISLFEIQKEMEYLLQKNEWADIRGQARYKESTNLLHSRERQTNPYLYVAVRQPDGTFDEVTYKQLALHEEIPSQLLRRILAPIFWERVIPSDWWDYHALEWRIWIEGFKNDIPRMNKMVHDFYNKQSFLVDIYSE